MKSKKNVKLILFPILFIIYIFLCYNPLSTELQMTPEWTLSLQDSISQNNSTLKVLPFKLGQNVGYFTHNGKLTSINNFTYKAAISKEYFAPYNQNSTGFDVFDTNGKISGTISGGGFPYIVDDKIFLMLPGGAGFEAKNVQNKLLTRFQHTSPITALNSNKYLTIAGFADGNLYTFDESFNLKYSLNPGGSDIGVILGANVSPKGNYFACVSGQKPQRFVLYKNEANHAKVIFHKTLEKNVITQTLLYFNNDESKVYYNDKTGLGIVDTENFKYKHIDIPGKILSIQESQIANSIFVLSKENLKSRKSSIFEMNQNQAEIGFDNDENRYLYTITILEQFSHKTGSFSFNADSAFILTDGNALFIGRNDKISKLSLSKE